MPLVTVARPGTRREALRRLSPVGGTRWWEITCRLLDATESARLHEITDETGRGRDDDRNDRWWLTRFESMAGMGSWEWDRSTARWSGPTPCGA